MIDQIKELRVKIDGLAQLTKGLLPLFEKNKEGYRHYANYNSEEINKSYNSLILAKAWLGKVLFELGDKTPYKSGYKTVSDIEPTVDILNKKGVCLGKVNGIPKIIEKDFISENYQEMNHIEKVDWLKTEIENTIIEVEKFVIPTTKRKLVICVTNTFTHLSEAKFHLGFELQRIKKQSNK